MYSSIFSKFQSTRPRGARPFARARKMSLSEFQSTRPRGARLHVYGYTKPLDGFNPRARAGRDNRPRLRAAERDCFNPRARAGRDQRRIAIALEEQLFQSTRPRGARLLLAQDQRATGRVSIHAPARGATSADCTIYTGVIVSIHAPARGATPVARPSHQAEDRFNPRARAGRDRGFDV